MKTTLLTISAIIIALLLMPVTTVYGGQTPSGIPFHQLEYEIDAFMAQHMDDIAGAAIVVVSDGEIIFSRGYGYANMAEQIPIDPAYHVFEHASISKIFVWTAAMQLVEQGRLDLDRYVHYYLSAESQRDFAFTYPITMRHLMNHTAGFEDTSVGVHVSRQRAETTSLREGLLYVVPRQIFTPGELSAYSNWGTGFAAYVVESIVGMPFYQVEHQQIFTPAGMTSTLNRPSWLHQPAFTDRMANIYALNHRPAPFMYTGYYPAGNARGTAEDLARFIIALTPLGDFGGALFQYRATVDTMLSSSGDINRPMMHHGFIPMGDRIVGHSGDLAGTSAMLGIVPDEHFGWVIMVNQGGDPYVRYGLGNLLVGTTMEAVRQMEVPNNLPSTSIVAGRFMNSRRVESNMGSAMSYAHSIYIVTPIDEEIIRFSLLGIVGGYYRQVAPFVYRLIEADGPHFIALFETLHFVVEDGVVTHIHIPAFDMTPLPRAFGFMIGSLAVTVVAILFFIVGLVVLVVKLVRKKLSFKNMTVGLFLSGLLLVCVNLLPLLLLMANPAGMTIGLVNTVVVLNYIFTGLVLLFACGNVVLLVKKGGTMQGKVMFATTTVIALAFIFVLYSWNFFVMM